MVVFCLDTTSNMGHTMIFPPFYCYERHKCWMLEYVFGENIEPQKDILVPTSIHLCCLSDHYARDSCYHCTQRSEPRLHKFGVVQSVTIVHGLSGPVWLLSMCGLIVWMGMIPLTPVCGRSYSVSWYPFADRRSNISCCTVSPTEMYSSIASNECSPLPASVATSSFHGDLGIFLHLLNDRKVRN